MTLLVLRHAEAGDREHWAGSDFDRPVTARGMAQAEALTELLPTLVDEPIARLLTSPYVRCRQSVEPIAARLGLELEDEPALAEEQPLAAAMALIGRLGPAPAVLCSHGDIIGHLLGWLAQLGVVEGELRCDKGATWVVERGPDGTPIRARYVEAP